MHPAEAVSSRRQPPRFQLVNATLLPSRLFTLTLTLLRVAFPVHTLFSTDRSSMRGCSCIPVAPV